MIKTLRFPRILFVSDAGHFWYVAALKIGPIGGCFFYFSYSRVFLSLNGLLLFYLFAYVLFYSVQSQWRKVIVQTVKR